MASAGRRSRRRRKRPPKLIDTPNEHDDVQNVYANFEVSDALMQKMSA